MAQKPQLFLLPLSYFLFQSQPHIPTLCGWVPMLLSAAPSTITLTWKDTHPVDSALDGDLRMEIIRWRSLDGDLSRMEILSPLFHKNQASCSRSCPDSSHSSVIYLGLPFYNKFPKFLLLFYQQLSPQEESTSNPSVRSLVPDSSLAFFP